MNTRKGKETEQCNAPHLLNEMHNPVQFQLSRRNFLKGVVLAVGAALAACESETLEKITGKPTPTLKPPDTLTPVPTSTNTPKPTDTPTPEPTATITPTETPNPILKADLILSDLPSWSHASVVQENGDYLIRDINNTIIARWNGTEWKDKKPIFYECGPGGVKSSYDGLPSGIALPEVTIEEVNGRLFKLAGCLIDFRKSNEDDPLQTGLVLTLRLWEEFNKYNDISVYLLNFADDGQNANAGLCLSSSGAVNCKIYPIDEIYEEIKAFYNDPKTSKQVTFDVAIEDGGMNTGDLVPYINSMTEKTEALYHTLENHKPLPEYTEGDMVFATGISFWK